MKLTLLPAALAIGCLSPAHAALPLTLDVFAQDQLRISSSVSNFAAHIPYSGQFFVTDVQGSPFTKSFAHGGWITSSHLSPAKDHNQRVPASESVESAATSIPETGTMVLFFAGILLTGTLRLRILNS
jgi:hypothetical protein